MTLYYMPKDMLLDKVLILVVLYQKSLARLIYFNVF